MAKRKRLTEADALKPLRHALADHDFSQAGVRQSSRHQSNLRTQFQRSRADAANDHVSAAIAGLLDQGDQHHQFLGHQRPTIAASGDFRLGFDDGRLLPFHAALHFGFRRAPDHHGVVEHPRVDQCLPQPFGQHGDGGEHEHHQRHARRRQQGGGTPRQQIAQAVEQQEVHALSQPPQPIGDPHPQRLPGRKQRRQHPDCHRRRQRELHRQR